MGEYFNWVNVDKKEYLCPADFDLGNKSRESSCKNNSLLLALYTLLSERWHGDRIVFLGDEVDILPKSPYVILNILQQQVGVGDCYDYICENYRNVSCLFAETESFVREHIANWLEDRKNGICNLSNEYGVDIHDPYTDLFFLRGKPFRYIVNHTRKKYYSLSETQILYQNGDLCDWLDPLPLLMRCGRSVNNGLWLDDMISVSDEPICGYTFASEIYLDDKSWDLVIPRI